MGWLGWRLGDKDFATHASLQARKQWILREEMGIKNPYRKKGATELGFEGYVGVFSEKEEVQW